jgi:peptidoglycan hydrolase-like protein with peptidoglycan-binding domain
LPCVPKRGAEIVMSIIFPSHQQLWPNQLLPTRLQEYTYSDGSPPTQDRVLAEGFVTGQQVIDAVKAAQLSTGLCSIDPRYFVGTAFHEAGVTSEVDTEIATSSDPTGFVSVGLYQISQDEAAQFSFSLIDLLDLEKSTECMVRLAEQHRTDIRAFMAALPPSSPGYLAASAADPDYTDRAGTVWNAGNMRAYLALCHNQGLGAAKYTIQNYGMGWAGYRSRNPTISLVSHGYGDDVITGGSYMPVAPSWPPTRLLSLISPPMQGADVAGLQLRLNVPGDGVFGPGTYAALRAFQAGAGLDADGVCGPATVAKLTATVKL